MLSIDSMIFCPDNTESADMVLALSGSETFLNLHSPHHEFVRKT